MTSFFSTEKKDLYKELHCIAGDTFVDHRRMHEIEPRDFRDNNAAMYYHGGHCLGYLAMGAHETTSQMSTRVLVIGLDLCKKLDEIADMGNLEILLFKKEA